MLLGCLQGFGVAVGFIFGVIIRKQGVSVEANLFWGVIGAIITGSIGFDTGLGDGVLFSFMATWYILLLINVFHRHHVEDVLGEIEYPAHTMSRGEKPSRQD